MNAALSAIAGREVDPRYMPEPPAAFHDHGHGLVEEVPLVSREFLLQCGTVALYIVLQEMDAPERFGATTKEELADLILAKTRGGEPGGNVTASPIVPPRPLTAREKRFRRSVKRQVRTARKGAVRTSRAVEGCEDFSMGAAGQIRNPKLEIRNKSQWLERGKTEGCAFHVLSKFHLFEFVSDFEFRISNFQPAGGRVLVVASPARASASQMYVPNNP